MAELDAAREADARMQARKSVRLDVCLKVTADREKAERLALDACSPNKAPGRWRRAVKGDVERVVTEVFNEFGYDNAAGPRATPKEGWTEASEPTIAEDFQSILQNQLEDALRDISLRPRRQRGGGGAAAVGS